MELGWGGFDRAKLDMLILIRIAFSFHVHVISPLGWEYAQMETSPCVKVISLEKLFKCRQISWRVIP